MENGLKVSDTVSGNSTLSMVRHPGTGKLNNEVGESSGLGWPSMRAMQFQVRYRRT